MKRFILILLFSLVSAGCGESPSPAALKATSNYRVVVQFAQGVSEREAKKLVEKAGGEWRHLYPSLSKALKRITVEVVSHRSPQEFLRKLQNDSRVIKIETPHLFRPLSREGFNHQRR